MNELLFFLHLSIVVGLSRASLRYGRDGLICWVVVQPILANLFVLKQITLFSYSVTCSDMYAVGAMLGLNLLQERYGKEAATKAARLCFYSLIVYLAMSLMHLAYIPNSDDLTQDAYSAILVPTPRLVAASVATFFIVQSLDIRIFSYLKKRFAHLSFLQRNCYSLTVSQFLDTMLFTLLGLWGLVASPLDVFFVSLAIKLSLALCLALFSSRNTMVTHDPLSL